MSPANELEYWKQLVEQRKEQLGSLQKVANELGYSRTSLSLALRRLNIHDEKWQQAMQAISDSIIPHYTNLTIRQSRKLNLLKYWVSVKLKNGMIWMQNMSISCLFLILPVPL